VQLQNTTKDQLRAIVARIERLEEEKAALAADLRKVYAEGQDPSQWDVIRSAAEEVGLDADEMQREVANETYRAAVEDRVRWAYQIGVTGVPTYAINNRYAIVGAQPYEVFKDVLEQIEKQEQAPDE